METSATIPSVIHAINVTSEDREKATAKFNKIKSEYYSAVESDYYIWTNKNQNLRTFLYATSQIEGIGRYGPMMIWINIWTVMELEKLEAGGHTVLGDLIAGMTSCNTRSLRLFVGDSSKPLKRCFEYMELLFND